MSREDIQLIDGVVNSIVEAAVSQTPPVHMAYIDLRRGSVVVQALAGLTRIAYRRVPSFIKDTLSSPQFTARYGTWVLAEVDASEYLLIRVPDEGTVFCTSTKHSGPASQVVPALARFREHSNSNLLWA